MRLIGPQVPAGGPPFSPAHLSEFAMALSAADTAARLWAKIFAQRSAIRDFAKGL